MPVTVPRSLAVNQGAPNQQSVGRLDAQAPLAEAAMDRVDASARHFGSELLDVMNTQEKAAVDTTAQSAYNRYHAGLETMLEGPNGAKFQQGDPTGETR